MNQAGALRRLEVVEAKLGGHEDVPTRCFFDIEVFQAQAFGTAEDVLELDAVIGEVDRRRHEQRLDLIDTAIFISRNCLAEDAQDAGAIAGRIVGAHWVHDRDQYGEDQAWHRQRSGHEFEGAIAARLTRTQG